MPLDLDKIYLNDFYRAVSLKEALTQKIAATLKTHFSFKKVSLISADKGLALSLSLYNDLSNDYDCRFVYLGDGAYSELAKKELNDFMGTFEKELSDSDIYILYLDTKMDLKLKGKVVVLDELSYLEDDDLDFKIDLLFAYNTLSPVFYTKNNFSHINEIVLLEDRRLDHYQEGPRLMSEDFRLDLDPLTNKGDYGRSLLIGGSKRMHGAIEMAATAAYHMGVGTLTLLIPDVIYHDVASKNSFAMILESESQDGYFKTISDLGDLVAAFDLVGAGNGMGRNSANIKIIEELLLTDKPIILDADALWCLKNLRSYLKRDALTILLPHLKEMTYLCDYSLEEIKKDPFKVAYEFTKAYPNTILVLKSYLTIVAHRNKLSFLAKPKRALAKGGSGDVLMGLVMGALSQEGDPFRMIELAVYVHNKAAETNSPLSFMVDDLIEKIPEVLSNIKG